MANPKRFHFLLLYPLHTAPSQRFRYEQYFPLLDRAGITYSTNSFYDRVTFSKIYDSGNRLALLFRLIKCFIRRCFHVLSLNSYDCIFIQRSPAPFGPPLFEWLIVKLFQKPIVYDFDDAIWLSPAGQSRFKKWVKATGKVGIICRWSHTVVAGNEYLAEYARRFNTNTVIIPTVVDTDTRYVPVSRGNNEKVVVGWTGSHTTLSYLEALEPVLADLQKQYAFTLLVMANKLPAFKTVLYRFVPWSESAEVRELQNIDVGIMPLPDDEWTKGKCGFKAIQYMALGKPAVASDVGVNATIIDHGINGFLCSTIQDWKQHLGYLLAHPEEVKQKGEAAREKIDAVFSLKKATVAWCKVISKI